MSVRPVLGVVVLACATVPAAAQSTQSGYGGGGQGRLIESRPLTLSEIRGGLLIHQFIGPKASEEDGPDLNLEVLVNGPWSRPTYSFWDNLTNPRLMFGGTVNLSGNTSFAYAGLDWNFALADRWYLGTGLGLGLTNGETSTVPGRIDMGCAGGFFMQGNLAYRLTPNWSLMGTVQHMSNLDLCAPNHGVNTLGLRAGYRF